jgi:hypothetical protein
MEGDQVMASIYQRPDSPYLWMSYKGATGKWEHAKTRYLKDNLEERKQAKEAAFRKSIEEKLSKPRIDAGEEKDKRLKTILAELCSLPGKGFFVYLVKSGEPLKVGKTLNLRNRMAHYRSHNPSYRLLGVRAFGSADQTDHCERDIKHAFKPFLMGDESDEWFKDATEVRNGFAEWITGQLLYLNFL